MSTGNFIGGHLAGQCERPTFHRAAYNHNGVNSVFWDRGPIGGGRRGVVPPHPFVSEWEHFVFTREHDPRRSMKIYANGALMLGGHAWR
ncbi:MAG: hypothetical protein IPI07_19595 [Flavobacteriales bacterium]|nr:hypothetical protein [Flavobacteriales bacterium]